MSREASTVIDEPIGDDGETGSSIADRPVYSSAPARSVDAADLVDPTEYRPCVSKDGVWTMSETDLGMSNCICSQMTFIYNQFTHFS